MVDDEDNEPSHTLLIVSSLKDEHGAYRRVEHNVPIYGDNYVEIMEQFVWFLNALGYNYIGALTAVSSDGEDLQTTNTI